MPTSLVHDLSGADLTSANLGSANLAGADHIYVATLTSCASGPVLVCRNLADGVVRDILA